MSFKLQLNGLFSEYVLPPIDRIPKEIEELIIIADYFLRLGPTWGFSDIFLDFKTFCKERVERRLFVTMEHNTRFDCSMIEGELRRWRFSVNPESK
eukprot:CCRYP_008556-RB/>CCRYP_008556-RB protein AED:0.47 eAED:0.52 QI:0/0/0/0.75/0/0/4/0/95